VLAVQLDEIHVGEVQVDEQERRQGNQSASHRAGRHEDREGRDSIEEVALVNPGQDRKRQAREGCESKHQHPAVALIVGESSPGSGSQSHGARGEQ